MALNSPKRRQLLRIVADDECGKCMGTGLHITCKHSGSFTNTVQIEVVVCACVKVVRRAKAKEGGDGPA